LVDQFQYDFGVHERHRDDAAIFLTHHHVAGQQQADIGVRLDRTVREEDSGVITVAFMDPEVVLKLVDQPEVHALGKEVRTLLQRVCASLKA